MGHDTLSTVMTANAYDELCAYTLNRGDVAFVHQHVVDAHAVQSATAETKPITVLFGLVGLYLHVECGQSGREVQRAHMRLAKTAPPWPRFQLPPNRGTIGAAEVLAAEAGPQRDAAIRAWAENVWSACRSVRPQVVEFSRQRGIVPAATNE